MRQALLALFVALSLALVSGASGTSVRTVSGKAVRTVTPPRASQRGWLELSSLSGSRKRPLTKRVGRAERRWDYLPTWSPDGSEVAFARWTPKQLEVMVAKEDGSRPRRVASVVSHQTTKAGPDAGIDEILWSPDGTKLAYDAWFPEAPHEGIYVASAAGSGQRLIASAGADYFLVLFGWSADGKRIAYASAGGEPIWGKEGPDDLETVSSDGGETKKLATADAITDASWLPDGSIAYVRHCEYSRCQLVLLDPTSGRSRPLMPARKWPGDADFGWDGLPFAQRPHTSDLVYTQGRRVYEVSPSTGKTRTLLGLHCPRRGCFPNDDFIALAGITRDGRFALIQHQNYGDSDYWGGPEVFTRSYRLDLKTGARKRIHLVTADPAEIYLR